MKFIHPLIKMTDSVETIFNLIPYGEDNFIDFQTIDIQEIEVPNDIQDVISILYTNETLNGSALYFVQHHQLTSMLYNIWNAGLVFDIEHMDDGTIFMTNFRQDEKELQTN